MDLSFAKDSKIFSLAVEQLRAEKEDLTSSEVIKARYDQLLEESGLPAVQESPVNTGAQQEVVEAPKKRGRKKSE